MDFFCIILIKELGFIINYVLLIKVIKNSFSKDSNFINLMVVVLFIN